MEEIKLIGADFNSGMPKWASDDALKKLTKSIENNQKYSKKIDDKTLKLLGTIAKGDKDNAKISKEIIKQLKLSNTKTEKLNTAIQKTNKQLSDISKSLDKKESKTPEKGGNSVSVDVAVDSDEIINGLGAFFNTTNKILNDINSSVSKSVTQFSKFDLSSLEIPNIDIEQNISTNNLEKLLSESMRDMNKLFSSYLKQDNSKNDKIISSIEKTNIILGYGSANTNKLLDDINISINDAVGVFAKINLSNIDIPEPPDIQINNHTSTEEIAEVLDSRLGDMHRAIANSMRVRGRNRSSGLKNKTLNAASKGLGNVLFTATSQLSGFVKKLPVIGAIITGLTSLAAALSFVGSSIKNAGWDYQKEYKEMMIQGFSFSVEALDGQIKMDGIRLRSMMTQTGMTIEDSMKLLEKNAILVNYMGVDKFAKTIGNVADAQNEQGVKFVDQMMMSREQLGEFTTQYLATARYLGQTELLNSEMRTRAAQQYIKDAKMFGQVVGVGLERITQSMEALQKSSDWALKTAHMDQNSDEYRTLRSANMAFQSMDIPEQLKQTLTNSLLDTRGIGLHGSDEGTKLIVGLQKLYGSEFTDKLDQMIKDVSMGEMSNEEFNQTLIDLQDMAENTKITKEAATSVAVSDDEAEKVSALLGNQFRTMNTDAIKNQDTTDYDKSSGVAKQQSETENEMTKAKNALDKLLLDEMDSEGAREALKMGLSAMEEAATATEAIVSGNKSIIAVLVEKFDSLMDLIKSMFSSLPFVDSPIENEREVLLERVYEDRGSDLAQNEQLQVHLTKEMQSFGVKIKEGFKTADITDGGLFSTGANEQAMKDAGLDEDSIIEKVSTLKTPEEFKDMALTLAKLANTRAIRDEDREVYAELLESLLDNKDDDGEIANYVVRSMEEMTRKNKSEDLVPNQIEVSESSIKAIAKNQDAKPKYEDNFSKPSTVAETAQNSNKQLEEQKKANEEVKRRQEELISQKKTEKEKTETSTTIKQEEAENKNNDSVLLDGLILVAGKLDEITRVLNNAVNENKKGKDVI